MSFLLTFFGREKLIVRAIMFLLPFAVLFSTSQLPIGLNGCLIWSTWLGLKSRDLYFKQKPLSWHLISKKLLWLYYFLIAGIIIGLMQTENPDAHTIISPVNQIVNVSLYIVTIILFIKILIRYRNDYDFQDQLKLFFLLSVFLQLLPFILPSFGSSAFSQDLLNNSSVEMSDTQILMDITRFSGVIGDYELIVDYAVIVIALAFIYLLSGRYKLLSAAVMMVAILVAFSSGTRSFLIVLPFFFIIYFVINGQYVKGNLTGGVIVGYASAIIVVGLLFYIFRDLPVFIRFQEAIGLYKRSGDLNEVSNRQILKALPDIFKNTSLLGNGSLYFTTFNGNEMVSHNLLLATFVKYGIVGVCMLLVLFVKPILLLIRTIKTSISAELQRESAVFVALLIALFVQELKISLLRYQTTMLVYTLMFIFVYFHLYRQKMESEGIE